MMNMNADKDLKIAKVIRNAGELIANDDMQKGIDTLNQLITEHPEWADERLSAEISILNHQIEEQKLLEDWAYFRAIRSVYQYCEAKFVPIIREMNAATDAEKKPQKGVRLQDADVIWWCWLQGLEQAPELVQRCYRSLEKLGRPIRIVTEENYSSYIELPTWILEKYKNGIIDRTHFSDLIRIELLTSRGGTWIDSTVYCTGTSRIIPLLESSELFAYSFVMRDSISRHILFDNWFLHSTTENDLLMDTKNLLYAYWKEEDTLLHYFIFHILFSIACRLHPEERRKIPIYSNEPCHVLQREMLEKYTKQRWEQIVGMSDIHKLTYKFDQGKELKGSFCEYLS